MKKLQLLLILTVFATSLSWGLDPRSFIGSWSLDAGGFINLVYSFDSKGQFEATGVVRGKGTFTVDSDGAGLKLHPDSNGIQVGLVSEKSEIRYSATFTSPDSLELVTDSYDTMKFIRLAEFHVVFNSQGSTTPARPNNVRFTKLTPAELPSPPMRDGFTFGGWFTQRDGMGQQINDLHDLDKDTTLFAYWVKVEADSVSQPHGSDFPR